MLRIEITGNTVEELKTNLAALYRELCEEPAGIPVPTTVVETPRRKFKVLLSPYPDINPGDIGEMMDELGSDTVALRFEKLFSKANALEHRELAKRIIAFDRKHIEEVK